jgi:RNA polymerase sigma-70 factor (ECF subfamily)
MGEPDHTTDGELVERFRAGDREAFATLYRAHFAAVFRFAFYMTGDRTRAGEITQDVFVWLIHHAAGFDARRGDLAAFLGGVARKFVRREERRERRWLPLDGTDPPARESDFAGMEREQEAAQLRKAIAALPAQYREAVVLCDLEGKSYDEAACAMQCAIGTVRSRLFRARELLARKLQWRREGQRCV